MPRSSFVLTEHCGVARSTIDADVADVRGAEIADIVRRAGRGSPLIAGLDTEVLRSRYWNELRCLQ